MFTDNLLVVVYEQLQNVKIEMKSKFRTSERMMSGGSKDTSFAQERRNQTLEVSNVAPSI